MVDKRFEVRLADVVRNGTAHSGMPHGTPVELKRIAAARLVRDASAVVLDTQVRAALRSGATWDEIGKAMGGVTRQAAQKRFKHLA